MIRRATSTGGAVSAALAAAESVLPVVKALLRADLRIACTWAAGVGGGGEPNGGDGPGRERSDSAHSLILRKEPHLTAVRWRAGVKMATSPALSCPSGTPHRKRLCQGVRCEHRPHMRAQPEIVRATTATGCAWRMRSHAVGEWVMERKRQWLEPHASTVASLTRVALSKKPCATRGRWTRHKEQTTHEMCEKRRQYEG
jgi:hypothetical protein